MKIFCFFFSWIHLIYKRKFSNSGYRELPTQNDRKLSISTDVEEEEDLVPPVSPFPIQNAAFAHFNFSDDWQFLFV